MPAVVVRVEKTADFDAITSVVDAAFGDPTVSAMVAWLRESPGYVPELAFVAEEAGHVVGYTMLSYVAVEGTDRRVLMLTPMAVRPDRQRRGIGTALGRAALAAADERGEPLVVVEGIPAYYPRFGFRPALDLGLLPPTPNIPEGAWMAIALAGYDTALRGRVVYPAGFLVP